MRLGGITFERTFNSFPEKYAKFKVLILDTMLDLAEGLLHLCRVHLCRVDLCRFESRL